MQDEMNEKIVSLSVRLSKDAAKLTEETLKDAIRKFLEGQEHRESRSGKNRSNGRGVESHGKQTVGQLMSQNQGLTNIEVTDGNIKSFERVARKYNIDFALKKDMDADPPKYLVFFKARDVDVMTAAFKEYTAREMAADKKPSLKKLLSKALEITANDREREKDKSKDRGQAL